MIVILGVSLYTSRVVLFVLGVEDYGIYNIVGSIVVLFSFISNSMIGASQRFFSYELGLESPRIKEVFSTSILAHIVFTFAILFIGETIGLWFVHNHLNLPHNRFEAALIVYQISLLTFIVNLLRIPYNAIIIAYERMSFFAVTSIIEALLKLIIVYALTYDKGDKLITYSYLTLFVTIICNFLYYIYTKRKLVECKFGRFWNKSMLNKLMGFIGWTLCGNTANIISQQGGNILLNIFFGVIVNTAFGIANQVNGAVNNLVSNFQLAFRPQIVKLYASGNRTELYSLVNTTSRISFYLLMIVVVPFITEADYLFSLWLKNVPPYSIIFCKLMLTYSLIDAIQAPLWMLIDATGKIKVYAIWLSCILIFNLPLSYFFLRYGYPAETLLLIRVLLNMFTAIIRTIYLKSFIGFPSFDYTKKILPCILVCIISYCISYVFKNVVYHYNVHPIVSVLFSLLFSLFVVAALGLSKKEKFRMANLIKSKIYNEKN